MRALVAHIKPIAAFLGGALLASAVFVLGPETPKASMVIAVKGPDARADENGRVWCYGLYFDGAELTCRYGPGTTIDNYIKYPMDRVRWAATGMPL